MQRMLGAFLLLLVVGFGLCACGQYQSDFVGSDGMGVSKEVGMSEVFAEEELDSSCVDGESSRLPKNDSVLVNETDGEKGDKDKDKLEENEQDNKNKNKKDEGDVKKKPFVVAIDAGHQEKGDSDKEAIGPGSSIMKAKVASGTVGVVSGTPEYRVNLDVALKLRDVLVARGYEVVMIRETNDVRMSNRERADVANDREADIFLRLHCNGAENESVNGSLTMCPTKENHYVGDLYVQSRRLSELVLNELCDSTKSKQCSIIETDSMSGINWCKIPVTIVEMGFMTNKREDGLLNDEMYQDNLAVGIANGVDVYFENSGKGVGE